MISHFIKRRLIAVDDKYNLNFITYKKDKVIAVTRRSTNTYQRFQQNYVAESRTGFRYQSKLSTELKTLYVFESCIDLMSYLSLVIEKKVDRPDKYTTCYISLNGANIKYISKILAENPSIENVVMCLDNDDFGIRTTETFMKTKVINTSEHIGILYWLDEDEKRFVKDFENENNAVVYHIVKTYTTIGCMLSVFYVSDDESEWESDREDIKIGEQLCYVKNIDNDDCSEFGYICFLKNCGGLMRTA